MANVGVDTLLGIGTAAAWVGAMGVLCGRDVYERLHYVAVTATAAAACFCAAIWRINGWSDASGKATVLLVLLAVGGAILSRATARASWVRAFGHWEPDVTRIEEQQSEATRPAVD